MSNEWWLIVAMGPSFRRADADLFRDKVTTVTVNCGVFFVPWAEHQFAADSVWWRHYGPMIGWYKGKRISRTHRAAGMELWRGKTWARTGGNSGHMAIQYAADQGAKGIILLGFDQQKTAGKAHCHADHPKMNDSGKRTNMANAGGIAAWPRLMMRTSMDLKKLNVRVINLSRETALKCFPRMTPEKFLEDVCH